MLRFWAMFLGHTYYRNVNRFKNLKERKDQLIIRFDADLYFANINYFKELLEEQIQRKGDDLTDDHSKW